MRPARRLYRVCQRNDQRSFGSKRAPNSPSAARIPRRLPLESRSRHATSLPLPPPLPSRGRELPYLSLLVFLPFRADAFLMRDRCNPAPRSRSTGKREKTAVKDTSAGPSRESLGREIADWRLLDNRASVIRYSAHRARRTEKEEGKEEARGCRERTSFIPSPPLPWRAESRRNYGTSVSRRDPDLAAAER